MKLRAILLAHLIPLLVGAGIPPANAQTNAAERTWLFRLLDGSYLVDDCLICGRPTFQQPMRGGFTLALTEDIPPFVRYEIRNISFVAGTSANGTYVVSGKGTLQIGGELSSQQEITLQVNVTDPSNSTTNKVFTNDVRTIDRAWPILDLHLVQTDPNPLPFYSLHLLAAPVRELWFSTAAGLTASKWQSPTNHVSAGDLIADSGRVIRSSGEFLGRLGLMPVVTDTGIDALDIAPGGEILFSLNVDVFSETLGPIRHGDLLSDRGAIVRRNRDLMAAFAPAETNADFGLDAAQVMTNGEIYFSITTNVVTPQIGTLFRGDILSDKGSLIRSNQQLLSRFSLPPELVFHDYGLDAIYVWPGGEIWFSTEEGFDDLQLGPVREGDLLSDQGYIVFRNLELTSAFAPAEDLADFGLDAIYVVTDATPPAPVPRLVSIGSGGQPGAIRMQWDGAGRVFQLEKASEVTGPFRPVSPLVPGLGWTDYGETPTNSRAFYRLRQW